MVSDNNQYIEILSKHLLEKYRLDNNIPLEQEIVIRDTGYNRFAKHICNEVVKSLQESGEAHLDIEKVRLSGSVLESIIKLTYKIPVEESPKSKQLNTLGIVTYYLGYNGWFDFIGHHSRLHALGETLMSIYVEVVSKELSAFKSGLFQAWDKHELKNGGFIYELKRLGYLEYLFDVLKLLDAENFTIQDPENLSFIKATDIAIKTPKNEIKEIELTTECHLMLAKIDEPQKVVWKRKLELRERYFVYPISSKDQLLREEYAHLYNGIELPCWYFFRLGTNPIEGSWVYP